MVGGHRIGLRGSILPSALGRIWEENVAAARRFLLLELRFHPLELLRQPINLFRRWFETRMAVVPYRAAMYRRLEIIS